MDQIHTEKIPPHDALALIAGHCRQPRDLASLTSETQSLRQRRRKQCVAFNNDRAIASSAIVTISCADPRNRFGRRCQAMPAWNFDNLVVEKTFGQIDLP
jgi:hypothetical protein